ncbi:YsnF/AvaK domain-containing protein [Isosphaeraceae bacterium EP7]
MAREIDKDEAKVDAKAAGAAGGGTAGALIGGAVGGPVGAGVGAVVGAAAGGLAGNSYDYNEAEPEFRRNWESSGAATRGKKTWADVSPAYRYGYENYSSSAHKGRSYDQVSAELKKGWIGAGKYEDHEPYIRTAWERRSQGTLDSGGEAVVPIIEEELKVGKRKVEKGGIHVETKVIETPVEQQVHLHDEKVSVKRRAVNREVTADDAAFREGTLELHESTEEAVVAKKARVVEEVIIGKEGHDRTETVRDTVRKTDVEVTKTAGKGKVSGTAWETYDTGFRKDFTSKYADSGYQYEQYAPAYRFGYDLAGDKTYQGDWTKVEPLARKSWEKQNQGAWEDFKDVVKHAWQKVTGER